MGVFGIGLAAYWPQFEGCAACSSVIRRSSGASRPWAPRSCRPGWSTPRRSWDAGDRFAANNVDLMMIVCYVGTYSTSSQVLPAVQRRKAPYTRAQPATGALHGLPQHRHGGWLANCCACCVPEISNAFAQPHQFNVVSGLLFPAPATPNSTTRRGWRGSRVGQGCRRAAELSYVRRFLGHPIRACSTCTPTSPFPAQLGAHIGCWRWTICARVSRPPRKRLRPNRRNKRRIRHRRAGQGQDLQPVTDGPCAGRRRWPWGWTSWSATSTSTG